MSYDTNTVANLIDLSADDESLSPHLETNPSSLKVNTPPIVLTPIAHGGERESLENNPFDCIQKQANRPDDPFELLSREASYQAHPSESVAAASQAEVRCENLLWISDDNIKVEDDNPPPVQEFSKLQVPSKFREPISSLSSIGSGAFSAGDDSAFTSRNDSSKTMNKAFITENSISCFSEDSRTQSLMNKGFVGSTSSFDVSQSPGNLTPEGAGPQPENSDSSGRGRAMKAVDARKRLLKLSLSNSTSNSPLIRRNLDDDNSSPLSVFSEAENLADDFISRFAFDSPKSFDDSCDDIMAIKPNWVDSETDIDSDLELMRIPILQEIASPVVSKNQMPWEVEVPEEENPPVPVICKNSPDFEALKEKVHQHKVENNNNHEIGSLIANLKQVIKDCPNDTKKAEANNLLESLSNLMSDKTGGDSSKNMDTLTPPPQPIVRQGTFDMDLKENAEREEREKQQENIEQDPLSCEDMAYEDHHHISDTNSTISGKTHSFHSPEIAAPEISQPEMSDIMEQIGRLLTNQNVNVVQANLSNASVGGGTNPTYIVVMNTPVPQKQSPSIVATEYQNDGSPDLAQSQVRRRSQSLSIPDKERQFVVPEIPSVQCKTPARGAMIRRNSFSSSTCSTPSVQMNRRSIYTGGPNTTEGVTKQTQMPRRSMALDTHHEKQQNVPQPHLQMPMGGLSLNAKKLKFKQSTESMFKANNPMKATIPVKKVAPMIVTTTADSPIEDSVKFKSVTSTPNVQLAGSKGYPSACSTPMVEASPIKRSGLTKSRYSFVAATPNPKTSSMTTSSSSQVRRRTMSEMRSPKKVIEKPTSSGISKPAVKTVKLPQNFSKTLNKMAPTTSKGVLRLTRQTATTTTSGAADKNKENKLPRTGR